ncbi:hypothetical protein L9F63_002161, partial [Diploptera punctata]
LLTCILGCEISNWQILKYEYRPDFYILRLLVDLKLRNSVAAMMPILIFLTFMANLFNFLTYNLMYYIFSN